jgi:hypothetical protein
MQSEELLSKNLTTLDEGSQELLMKMKLLLRPEQVIVYNMLLSSPSKITLIELGTNFGKSRVIGPLADRVR